MSQENSKKQNRCNKNQYEPFTGPLQGVFVAKNETLAAQYTKLILKLLMDFKKGTTKTNKVFWVDDPGQNVWTTIKKVPKFLDVLYLSHYYFFIDNIFIFFLPSGRFKY